ncbi:MAG: hypothetical protein U0556_17595 [Dehalococcoidia bacterium]
MHDGYELPPEQMIPPDGGRQIEIAQLAALNAVIVEDLGRRKAAKKAADRPAKPEQPGQSRLGGRPLRG